MFEKLHSNTPSYLHKIINQILHFLEELYSGIFWSCHKCIFSSRQNPPPLCKLCIFAQYLQYIPPRILLKPIILHVWKNIHWCSFPVWPMKLLKIPILLFFAHCAKNNKQFFRPQCLRPWYNLELRKRGLHISLCTQTATDAISVQVAGCIYLRRRDNEVLQDMSASIHYHLSHRLWGCLYNKL